MLGTAARQRCDAAEVCDYRLRQARWKRARIRFRPRSRVPVRRPRRRRAATLCAARATAQHRGDKHDRGRASVRHGSSFASRRGKRVAGFERDGISQLPARPCMDLGAPGADPCALRRRRREDRRRFRGRARNHSAPASRLDQVADRRHDHASTHARCASESQHALRSQARPWRHGGYRIRSPVPGSRACPRRARAARRRPRWRRLRRIANIAACSIRSAFKAHAKRASRSRSKRRDGKRSQRYGMPFSAVHGTRGRRKSDKMPLSRVV